ncbi:phytanoyl-CoA dioxygenase family protein [Prosthecobacter vanneervenii]|uniref:Ectoine hydroxylase-related dioxygenase (Phytanoyl-CoA dioxygenase family) n=1 Tax=Prosthecobacter vanneervenii TaxID=48466 RepID=A0A7W7YAK8_9BACT|nr:phytanoyl-CoA dioxygenase family protein [Prosthecobacter vanneervenii]MBB5032560.1 ectoine hydroxylase-related dioxygenase (phytanoyl-CoA dioxygenase family) [Prosthecobacter vanneervenii]
MNLAASLDADGYVIVPNVLDDSACDGLRSALGDATGAGSRGMLHIPVVADLAQNILAGLVRPHLPSDPVPVRGIYFDKRPETNWLVAWHQDLTLALRAPVESPGFGPWSVKDGVPHVQPPVPLLEQMLAVRLHLDDANAENGALRVLPGTHRLGRLSAESIQQCRETHCEVLCEARAGDVLLMRPLLLHASSRSTSTSRRRVLHVEFAGFYLPPPMEWHEAPCQRPVSPPLVPQPNTSV